MRLKVLLLYWLPIIAWMGLIFWWSSIPHLGVGTGWVDYWTRKPAHIAEYTILFLLIYRAIFHQKSGSIPLRLIISLCVVAAIATILYAVSDEWHQTFVPTRTGKPVDLIFDATGIIVGIGIIWWWAWWRRVTESPAIQPDHD